MKITCHSCSAKYTVSDDKVQGKTVKMKCRKCGATIVVGGAAHSGDAAQLADDAAVAQTAPQDPGAQDAPPPGSFLVNVADGDQRTMTLAEVVEAYNGGVITGDTYIWADGMNDWQAVSENEQIVAALNEAAKASAALTGGSNGAGFGASAPLAAASSSKKGKSSDLFGAGGGVDSSGAALASSSSSSSTGKRDENSVLFSLNALTGTAPSASSSSKGSATKEDSGLIDLKALAASAAPAATASDVAPLDSPGLFPIGAPVIAPPPPPAAVPAVAAPPPKASKLPIVFGGIAVLAVAVAIFVVVKSGDSGAATGSKPEEKPTSTSVIPTQQAAATNTTPASATATATESAAEASASATETAGTKPTGTVPGKKTATNTATTATTKPTQTATQTATTPPKKDGCNCGSDLNCQLKCVAGKKK